MSAQPLPTWHRVYCACCICVIASAESLLLATVGITGALLLAQRLITLIPALLPNIGYPLSFDFRIDSR